MVGMGTNALASSLVLVCRPRPENASLATRKDFLAETARELAYRLYSICERQKWADEALAYNGLVIAWPELTKLALAARSRQPAERQ